MGICISYLRTLTLKICPTAIIAQQSNQTRNLSVFSKSSDVSETSPRFNSFNLEFLPQKQQLPPSTQNVSPTQEKIETLFKSYQNCEGVMDPDGVERFFNELGVDPLDVSVLVLCWHFKAQRMCYFTQEEFVTGLLKLNCSTLQELKRKLPRLKKDLDNNQTFTEIYEYAFEFSKDDPTQKALPMDVAKQLLSLLLVEKYPIMKEFLKFLEQENHGYNTINYDQWKMLLKFCLEIKPDLSNYNSNDAWPVIIDEFVEWKQKNTRT